MVNFRKKYLKYKKKYIKCKKNLKGGSASNIEPGSGIWDEFRELLIEDIELSEVELTTEVLNNYIQEIFIILDTIYNSDLNNLDEYLVSRLTYEYATLHHLSRDLEKAYNLA